MELERVYVFLVAGFPFFAGYLAEVALGDRIQPYTSDLIPE